MYQNQNIIVINAKQVLTLKENYNSIWMTHYQAVIIKDMRYKYNCQINHNPNKKQ